MHIVSKCNFEEILRFISETKRAVKIHVHMPDDTIVHKSFGALRDREKALKRAIKERDRIGKKAWGQFWERVLYEEGFFERIPHSMEPAYIEKPATLKSGEIARRPCYLAKWVNWEKTTPRGKTYYSSKVFSIEKYGKLAAYSMAKKALQEGYKNYIPIVNHMERYSVNKLL